MRPRKPHKEYWPERASRRNACVRRLTGWSAIALCALLVVAVWQDRALAPPLHDGLHDAVARGVGLITGNEALAVTLDEFQREYARRFGEG